MSTVGSQLWWSIRRSERVTSRSALKGRTRTWLRSWKTLPDKQAGEGLPTPQPN
jgi:hypothetical protein